MSKYRNNLPQLADRLFLTDGGLETTLIFHDGIELPHFASFDLLKSETGVARLRSYKESYIALAKRAGIGFILEGATWRANPDWGVKLGYSREALAQANRRSIEMMAELRRKHETAQTPIVISGNIGPRGDGYQVGNAMTAKEAQDYHSFQIDIFAGTEADMISAFTINYVDEAIGIVRAAKAAQMPVVISFTLETDGKLPSGQSLKDAIEQCDRETGGAAGLLHDQLRASDAFRGRAEEGRRLDQASARPARQFLQAQPCRARCRARSRHRQSGGAGQDYRKLRALLPQLTILGGCCGTDHRHVEQICASCVAAEAAA